MTGAITTTVRIALHQRVTGAAGHQQAQLGAVATVTTNGRSDHVGFRSFLGEFAVTSFAFTIAHGVFLAAMLGFMLREQPDPAALREGANGIAVCQAIALAIDLKLLSDIGSMMPEANPKEPPRWLARIANAFPKQKGESFEQYWRRTRAENAAAAEQDERRS